MDETRAQRSVLLLLLLLLLQPLGPYKASRADRSDGAEVGRLENAIGADRVKGELQGGLDRECDADEGW